MERNSEFGTLTDYRTGQELGPASREQRDLSRRAGFPGAFRIDRAGDPCPDDADEDVFGPTRVVFVAEDRG